MARKRRRLNAAQKRKIARNNDVLHSSRRVRGGDQIMIRPKPDAEPSKVVRYIPDENGNLIELVDD